MEIKEAEEILADIKNVRMEKLNPEAIKLYEAINIIINDRNKYKMLYESNNHIPRIN